MRHLSGLLTVLLIAPLLAVGLTAAPASARTPANFQNGIHRLTNDIRADHDKGKLAKRKCVKKFAKKQAKKMARQERMFHQALKPIATTCGLTGVGENVAMGFTSPQCGADQGGGRPLEALPEQGKHRQQQEQAKHA